VAAGVVGAALVAAVPAMLDLATQRGGTADNQVAQGLALLRRERTAVPVEACFTPFANHVRHVQSRPLPKASGPARPSPGGTDPVGRGSTSRSSRLGVGGSRWVLTCR